jgi:hypothetical protein
MNPRITRLLFDHGIHNVLPARKAVGVLESIFEHIMVNGPDRVTSAVEYSSFHRIRFEAIGLEQGMVVAEMSSGWRRARRFIPNAVRMLHFGQREFRGQFLETAIALLQDFGRGGRYVVVGAKVRVGGGRVGSV